mmetsp:Transcript_10644/g.43642  ORF Transcript_10644/g.43642 Transcript_10644/m.43642 type:complete len:241 (+) Transcript_10644:96-818(+)
MAWRNGNRIGFFFVGQHGLEQGQGQRALGRQREFIEPLQQGHQAFQVAFEAGQQIGQELIAEQQPAAVGLAPQHRAHLVLAQRLKREARAPSQAGTQVLAHGEVDRRRIRRRDDVVALPRRGGEQCEGGMLLAGVEALAVVQQQQALVGRQLPGQWRVGVVPGNALAGRLPAPGECMQQMGLAAARRAPEQHWGGAGHHPEQIGLRLSIRARQEVVEAVRRRCQQRKRNLPHHRNKELAR